MIGWIKRKGSGCAVQIHGKSDEVQGIVFFMNGYSFSGPKIDRQFSYSKIDVALKTTSHPETKIQVDFQSEPAY